MTRVLPSVFGLGLFLCGAALPAQDVAAYGNFRFVTMQDEMGDAGTSYVYVMADHEIVTAVAGRRITFTDRDPALVWMCVDGALSVVYRFDTPLAGDAGSVLVRYRLDETPATEFADWPLNAGLQDEATEVVADSMLEALGVLGDMMSGLGMSANMPATLTTEFTDQALRAERLLVRVSDPFDGETHTDTFRLDGMGEALARLACQ